MFQTLQDCQHSIRTDSGDSEETYGGKETPFIYPPQGIGQGNRTGLQVWGTTSSGMLQTLHDKGLTTNIITPISKEPLELCGFTFVVSISQIIN